MFSTSPDLRLCIISRDDIVTRPALLLTDCFESFTEKVTLFIV